MTLFLLAIKRGGAQIKISRGESREKHDRNYHAFFILCMCGRRKAFADIFARRSHPRAHAHTQAMQARAVSPPALPDLDLDLDMDLDLDLEFPLNISTAAANTQSRQALVGGMDGQLLHTHGHGRGGLEGQGVERNDHESTSGYGYGYGKTNGNNNSEGDANGNGGAGGGLMDRIKHKLITAASTSGPSSLSSSLSSLSDSISSISIGGIGKQKRMLGYRHSLKYKHGASQASDKHTGTGITDDGAGVKVGGDAGRGEEFWQQYIDWAGGERILFMGLVRKWRGIFAKVDHARKQE